MNAVDVKIDSDYVATVTLNRPKALNALDWESETLLRDAWAAVEDDPAVRAVVLQARGDKAFCVGADLKDDTVRPERIAFGGGLTGIGGPRIRLSKPLIAAVRGVALGGGFELAMCADLIVVGPNAQFGLPEIKAGIIGESGVLHRVVRQLPRRVAMGMILTGDWMRAEEALGYGLVNEIEADDAVERRSHEIAAVIASFSPMAVRAAKAAVEKCEGWPLDVALSTRFEEIERYQTSEDAVEAIEAFRSKRMPEWQDR